MAVRQAIMGQTSPSSGTARRLWIAPMGAGGVALFVIAYGANRETVQDVEARIAHEERAFCSKLGMQSGTQYESCLREVSRLVGRELEIRSVEF